MDYIIAVVYFSIFMLEWFEKGVPINDIYFTNPDRRATANWKPYYRQAAIVFLILGLAHLSYGLSHSFNLNYLYILGHIFIILAIIYWFISQVKLPDIE